MVSIKLQWITIYRSELFATKRTTSMNLYGSLYIVLFETPLPLKITWYRSSREGGPHRKELQSIWQWEWKFALKETNSSSKILTKALCTGYKLRLLVQKQGIIGRFYHFLCFSFTAKVKRLENVLTRPYMHQEKGISRDISNMITISPNFPETPH